MYSCTTAFNGQRRGQKRVSTVINEHEFTFDLDSFVFFFLLISLLKQTQAHTTELSIALTQILRT
jgi:hypothetical protein